MLRKAWRGEERLWKVWWVIGIPVTFMLLFLDHTFLRAKPRPSAYMPALIFYTVLYFGWTYMAWLCARNVDRSIWMPVAYFSLVYSTFSFFKVFLLP